MGSNKKRSRKEFVPPPYAGRPPEQSLTVYKPPSAPTMNWSHLAKMTDVWTLLFKDAAKCH